MIPIGEVSMLAESKFDPHDYTIVIRRVVRDGEPVFYGRVVELPDLEAFEPSFDEAYDFLIDAIQTAKETFDEKNRAFPPPLPQETSEYSGRVTIRMPRWLHAQLDHLAQMDGISLNQHMVAILASSVTPRLVAQHTIVGSISGAIGGVSSEAWESIQTVPLSFTNVGFALGSDPAPINVLPAPYRRSTLSRAVMMKKVGR